MKKAPETEANLSPLLLQRPTMNPYRYAMATIIDRLRWDLRPVSWTSRARLKNLKDSHAGQPAVIVCNGPSLLKTDLSLLKGVFTFGLNKINLLFPKSEFRPSCIVAINELVIEQNTEFFQQTEIPLFIGSNGARFIKARPNVTFLHLGSQHKLARDATISVHAGYTVTVVALQLAFHMGFTEVALIGCDHSFAAKGPSNMVVTAESKDLSHFDDKYFAPGVKWQLPDLTNSELFYCLANELYTAFGRRITNCTPDTRLEVFQQESLSNWLSETQRGTEI